MWLTRGAANFSIRTKILLSDITAATDWPIA